MHSQSCHEMEVSGQLHSSATLRMGVNLPGAPWIGGWLYCCCWQL